MLNHKNNGELLWNRLLVSPMFDCDGTLTYFFASQFNVTLKKEKLVRVQADRDALEREVERRTSNLVRSEERLRFILKAGRLGSWALDLVDMRLVLSETYKAYIGRAPQEPAPPRTILRPSCLRTARGCRPPSRLPSKIGRTTTSSIACACPTARCAG